MNDNNATVESHYTLHPPRHKRPRYVGRRENFAFYFPSFASLTLSHALPQPVVDGGNHLYPCGCVHVCLEEEDGASVGQPEGMVGGALLCLKTRAACLVV